MTVWNGEVGKVWEFSFTGGVGKEGEFPMNKSDPAFGETSDGKFSCAYSGRHDHGELPPQRRDVDHEHTLQFIEWARKTLMDHFSAQSEEQTKGSRRPTILHFGFLVDVHLSFEPRLRRELRLALVPI